jgi:hypothetical protein
MRRSLNAVSLLAVYMLITGPTDVGKPFGNDYSSIVNDFYDGFWTFSRQKFWTLDFWVKPNNILEYGSGFVFTWKDERGGG